MIPGMNPRMMKQAMKRMGIEQEEIDAKEVIIKCPDKDIIITNAQVSKINMMGQETFQVVGEVSEQEHGAKPEITEEDIKTVMEQTNCSREQAEKALKEAEGDLAEAIIKLEEE